MAMNTSGKMVYDTGTLRCTKALPTKDASTGQTKPTNCIQRASTARTPMILHVPKSRRSLSFTRLMTDPIWNDVLDWTKDH